MPFIVPLERAKAAFPEYTFIGPLTPSEQKAAFHVRNSDGDDLCLKIISPNYSVDRLAREIQALQSISHQNIVALKEYTFSSTPGSQRHFIIEEFVAGHDLSAQMQSGVAWPRVSAAKTFAAVCDGLSAMHAKRIVHRDLKPNNIRVRPDGTPVVIDFGLARMLTLPDITSTTQGAGIGTPLYFAPEQFAGTKREIDHRTDLFALGIILLQALMGMHPFWVPNMTRAQLSDAVCRGRPYKANQAYASLPRQWKLLVDKLLAVERSMRIQTADQAAALLRKLEGI